MDPGTTSRRRTPEAPHDLPRRRRRADARRPARGRRRANQRRRGRRAGRSYLVEPEVDSMAELEALAADYIAKAARLGYIAVHGGLQDRRRHHPTT